MNRSVHVLASSLIGTALSAQPAAPRPTAPPVNQAEDPMLRGFRWRQDVRGGRPSVEPRHRGGQMLARLANPCAYIVPLTVNGKDYTRPITVLEDIWMEAK